MVSGDGSVDPSNTPGFVRDCRWLRTERTASHERPAVPFVAAKTVVAFSVAGRFSVGGSTATNAVQVGDIVVGRVGVAVPQERAIVVNVYGPPFRSCCSELSRAGVGQIPVRMHH